MSVSNIQDQALRNFLRNLDQRLSRIESQLSTFVKNNSVAAYHSQLNGLSYAESGHTGFASSADITSHTGDATIHFTRASISDGLLHVGGSAPTGSESAWLDTSPSAPYSTAELKLSSDGGSTWQRVGIGW